ncbi:LicD family protein [Paenibacillus sp. TSA_86.1]|uniref:LicD family protein n=1 Tax=Paenibacillus sp. TSA_86.1 TaxID=3415649 RepID=UPI004045CF3A
MSVWKDQTFFEEEVKSGYTVSTEIKKIWAVELDLISKLREVCERYHLTFFIAGGTLLGAVRHQGFIPWDDDADFLMPRADFEKLKEIAHIEFTDPYFLQTEESEVDMYLGGFARLRNSHTTQMNQVDMNRNANLGIWIDISILDYLEEDEVKRKKQVDKIRFFQRLMYAKIFREQEKFLELSKPKWKLFIFFANLLSREWILKKLQRSTTSCEPSNYVTSFSYQPNRYYPKRYETEIFIDKILLNFHELKLPAPIGFNKYLEHQYGEKYMKYPPEDERRPTHLGIISTEIPYQRFLLNFHSFQQSFTGKTIVIFGAGQMLEYYLMHEGKTMPPEFIIDNSHEKWGTHLFGLNIKKPDSLYELSKSDLVIIICSIHYKTIANQLTTMGFDYYIYVQNKDWL